MIAQVAGAAGKIIPGKTSASGCGSGGGGVARPKPLGLVTGAGGGMYNDRGLRGDSFRVWAEGGRASAVHWWYVAGVRVGRVGACSEA
jgi:hypothetical protein